MATRLKKNADPNAGGEYSKETFQSQFASLQKLRRDHEATVDEQRKANAVVRDQRKFMKKSGADLDLLKIAEMIADIDPELQKLSLQKIMLYLEWMNAPAGSPDLVELAAKNAMLGHNSNNTAAAPHGSEGPDDRALHEGAIACGKGELESANPYQVGTTEHEMWKKGFFDEMQDRLDHGAAAADAAKANGTNGAAKGRGGRKKGTSEAQPTAH